MEVDPKVKLEGPLYPQCSEVARCNEVEGGKDEVETYWVNVLNVSYCTKSCFIAKMPIGNIIIGMIVCLKSGPRANLVV